MSPAPRLRRITRRRLGSLLVIGATASVVGAIPPAIAQNDLSAAQAAQFIQQSGDRLVTILNGPGDWPTKSQQLQALIDTAIDVRGVARFALGRFWNAASERQRDEFVRLFPEVLIGSVGQAVGAYEGLSFTVERATRIDETVAIRTTILRPGDAPREVTWMIGLIAGVPKITDIVAEGASMRITQRADCASYLAQGNHNIQDLIEMLRQREAKAM